MEQGYSHHHGSTDSRLPQSFYHRRAPRTLGGLVQYDNLPATTKEWISHCIQYLRSKNLHCIEPTREAEEQWVAHHDELANATLVSKTSSWYMGSNVEGKPRRLLSYIGGVGEYRKRCDAVAAQGYPGFAVY